MNSVIFNAVEFLNFATYNKLLDYVDLPASMASELCVVDPKQELIHCEPLNADTTRVYYPIQSWINELKRRKECETILADCSKLHIDVATPRDTVEDIQKLIMKAVIKGDFEEVNKLNDRLQKLTHE